MFLSPQELTCIFVRQQEALLIQAGKAACHRRWVAETTGRCQKQCKLKWPPYAVSRSTWRRDEKSSVGEHESSYPRYELLRTLWLSDHDGHSRLHDKQQIASSDS